MTRLMTSSMTAFPVEPVLPEPAMKSDLEVVAAASATSQKTLVTTLRTEQKLIARPETAHVSARRASIEVAVPPVAALEITLTA